jgi:hypothetical protein
MVRYRQRRESIPEVKGRGARGLRGRRSGRGLTLPGPLAPGSDWLGAGRTRSRRRPGRVAGASARIARQCPSAAGPQGGGLSRPANPKSQSLAESGMALSQPPSSNLDSMVR